MREKLLDLMKNEGLKPSQLAEQLEINPAGISHILAGRNKPGFDLLQKILRRFPRINPDWLLLDSDKMYRDEYPAASSGQQASRTTAAQRSSPELGNDLFTPTLPGGLRADEKQTQDADGHDGSATQFPPALFGKANIKRVVVLYDDQTFESFTPSTKRSNNPCGQMPGKIKFGQPGFRFETDGTWSIPETLGNYLLIGKEKFLATVQLPVFITRFI